MPKPTPGKFDMKSIAAKLKKSLKDDKLAAAVGTAADLKNIDRGVDMTHTDWWKPATGVNVVPFGKMVMFAGNTDSGKTSAAIETMKAAIAQGVGVIYVETEGKTKPQDLRDRGLDPEQILLVNNSVTEVAFSLLIKTWDAFFDANPEASLLVVIDSIGNTISQREADTDLSDVLQLGVKAKANRRGLNAVIAKMHEDDVALFVVTYTYNNLGSPGKSNAGGKASDFFSSLTFQCTRVKWIEKIQNKEKVRVGATVKWTIFKNHLLKTGGARKSVLIDITEDGLKLVE